VLTGKKPKIMSIFPFGCMAYADKPVGSYLKSTLEARAWTGYDLGRANHTPGADNIWLPNLQKVVCTSEVYFDEGLMPWRPKGDRRIGNPLPSEPPEGSDTLDATVTAPPEPSVPRGTLPASLPLALEQNVSSSSVDAYATTPRDPAALRGVTVRPKLDRQLSGSNAVAKRGGDAAPKPGERAAIVD